MSGTLSNSEYIGSGAGNSENDNNTTIVGGGVQYVGYDLGIGTATSTTVDSGGVQYVGELSGTGTVTGATLSGGFQFVGDNYGTGTATSTTILSGGTEFLGAANGSGTATATLIDGGVQDVGFDVGTGSATATSTTILSGEQFVGDEVGFGTATDTTIEGGVNGGGYQFVGWDGGTGTATSTTIGAHGEQDLGVAIGGIGMASFTTIESLGVQHVGELDGGIGTATSTTIESGGRQYVGWGGGTGTATSTKIESGGYQYVGWQYGSGTATSTTISGGGTQYVAGYYGTGTATSTWIRGGVQLVGAGGTATDTTIFRGGFAGIGSGGVVDAPVIEGGELELTKGASVGSGGIAFAAVSGGHWGVLNLIGEGTGSTFASDFTAVISGFAGVGDTAATSDEIGVTKSASVGDHVVWTQLGASGTLQVETSGGTVLETLTLAGTFFQNDFMLTETTSGDRITYDSNALCYCRGTRILTDQGEVVIERLAIGDRVVTASGESKPIRWIGHRRVEIARHPHPEAVRPVRIEAGALAHALPARDLLLSPEHALWLREALVPARELINGATIRQEAWSRVEYFHLKLDSHEILLAEGVPAESYLDCDNRRGFDNAPDGVVALHPDWRRRAESRRFASSAQMAGLRAEFSARAVTLGRGAEIADFAATQRARGTVTRTNFVRNPRAEGSVRGILGAGGHAPTHWRLWAPDGLAIEVMDAGEEEGLPFIDLRFVGLAEAGGPGCIQPEPRKAAAARPGQEWTLSCYLRHVAGGFDGVESVNLYIDERGANGAYLGGEDYPPFLPTADGLALQRVEATRKMSRPDVAAVTGYVQIKLAAGAPIDLTLRVAGLQIERGHYASALILPPAGQMRPSTRGEESFAPPARRSSTPAGLRPLPSKPRQQRVLQPLT